MTKFINFLFIASVALVGNLSNVSGQQHALDTIYKIEGKVLPVNVVNTTESFVSFTVPGNNETYTMPRKDIQKIVYRTGRIDEFNQPVFQMISNYSWQAVWLTNDIKDVKDLYKRGVVSAQSPASSRSPKAAKKSTIIKIQKKAAAMKGTVVYVTKKETTGGYGEFPGYYIEGVVYGDQPLKEGESEHTDKDVERHGS